MQQHGRMAAPLSPQKVKIQLFQNMVMLHTKGNSECSNMVTTADRGTLNMKHIKRGFRSKVCAHPLGGLRGWDQNVKIHFFRTWSCYISN